MKDEPESLEKRIKFLNIFYSIDKENLVHEYTRTTFVQKYQKYDMATIRSKLDYMLRERIRADQRRKNSWQYIMKGQKPY